MYDIFSLDYWLGVLYSLPGIVVGLSFHEFAHAFVAFKMGDSTAKNMGRMTLNPMAHIDPLGFLSLIILRFGWAKPVPVNPRNYSNYRVGETLVSLAGIAMNLLLSLFGVLLLYLSFAFKLYNNILLEVLISFIFINISLMVFNLLPLPPLDGSHLLELALPPKYKLNYMMYLRKYSWIILLGVLLILSRTGILTAIVSFFFNAFSNLFALIFGVMPILI